MTPSEFERLASIEAILGGLKEDIGEIKNAQSQLMNDIKGMCSAVTTHRERIRVMGKSLAGVWAVVSTVAALLIGAFVSHVMAGNGQIQPREVRHVESIYGRIDAPGR